MTLGDHCRVGLLLLSLSLLACSRDEGGSGASAEAVAGVIERKLERGPMKVVVRVSPERPTIADRIRLEMEVEAEDGDLIEFPALGEKLDQFGIVDFSTGAPELKDDGRVGQVRTYVLEPFLSGTYVIPPMVIGFGKRDGEQYELETEEIQLEVRSLLPEEKESLQIHGIAPPVVLPEGGGGGMLVWILTFLVLGGLVAGAWWWWRRKREGDTLAEPRRPADEIALEALDKLIAEDLPGRGETKRFYQRISQILRHYIEDRFGIHAPGQTTEEFLTRQTGAAALEGAPVGLLKEFLQHCDLVKFAEHQPETREIEKTFDTCKSFILETKKVESEEANPEEEPVR